MPLPQSSTSDSSAPSRGRTARELVARGALLLDVRMPEEFSEEHVPGAVNVPLHEVPARVRELGSEDRPVVVYCRSGRRSADAARLLRERGFRHVHDLGSMSAWSAH